MADTTISTFKNITKDQITDWKKTKGNLMQVAIPLDDNPDGNKAEFIICKPTRNLLPAITQYGAEKNIDALNNLLISSCVLGGDMKYLDEENGEMDVYLAVLEEVGKLMQAKRVTSKRI